MTTYAKQAAKNHIIGMVRSGQADIQTDNDKQLVIYTGLYVWPDGTVRDEEPPIEDTVRDEEPPIENGDTECAGGCGRPNMACACK